MPRIHIIAGPPGAGKTTFAKEYLPQEAACRNFVDADLIDPEALPVTVATLARHLPGLAATVGARDPHAATTAVQAALVGGYLARMRDRILDEQEMMRQAEMEEMEKQWAEHNRRIMAETATAEAPVAQATAAETPAAPASAPA